MHSIHPMVLAAIVGVLFALTAIIAACVIRQPVVRAAMVVLAILFILPGAYLFIALNPGLFDARFRTYRSFYGDIDVGMTRAEVFTALELNYPKNGPRLRPKLLSDTSEGISFFMNPESSREPNCEGIFLDLEHGRVTRKTYSAD